MDGMNEVKRILLVSFVLLSGVGCDQVIKTVGQAVLSEYSLPSVRVSLDGHNPLCRFV